MLFILDLEGLGFLLDLEGLRFLLDFEGCFWGVCEGCLEGAYSIAGDAREPRSWEPHNTVDI